MPAPSTSVDSIPSLLSDQDLYLFNEGSNYRLYETMGAHLVAGDGLDGAIFSVWAPNVCKVAVNDPTPFVKVEFAGRLAAPSVLVK